MNDFSEFDLQLMVYSKGWYARSGVMSDIRQLISKTRSTDVKFIKDKDVLMCVAVSVHKFGISDSDLRELYYEIWRNGIFDMKSSITMVDQIESLLSVIHFKTPCDYPIKLPAPDPKYLPLARDGILDLWHRQQEGNELQSGKKK